MYKLYINEKPLFLCSTDELQNIEKLYIGQKILSSRYNGKTKSILHHVDMMEKGQVHDAVVIFHHDLGYLKNELKSLFKTVKAGGGVVKNPQGQILLIYRRGSWDLPKGKMDKGETKKEAAVREVKEECGLKHIILGDKIITTKHSYVTFNHGKRAIKKTHWYAMETNEFDLIPQLEEDIEQAVWVDMNRWREYQPMYKTIEEVLSNYESNHADQK